MYMTAIGRWSSGRRPLRTANIIPDTAVLQGTIRSIDKACRELLVRRVAVRM